MIKSRASSLYPGPDHYRAPIAKSFTPLSIHSNSAIIKIQVKSAFIRKHHSWTLCQMNMPMPPVLMGSSVMLTQWCIEVLTWDNRSLSNFDPAAFVSLSHAPLFPLCHVSEVNVLTSSCCLWTLRPSSVGYYISGIETMQKPWYGTLLHSKHNRISSSRLFCSEHAQSVRYVIGTQKMSSTNVAGCFALFVFLVSCDCCVALPHDAMGLPAVCDCGISWSYLLTICKCKMIKKNLTFVLLHYWQSTNCIETKNIAHNPGGYHKLWLSAKVGAYANHK